MPTNFSNDQEVSLFTKNAIAQGINPDEVNAFVSSKKAEVFSKQAGERAPVSAKLQEGNLISKILGGALQPVETGGRLLAGAAVGGGGLALRGLIDALRGQTADESESLKAIQTGNIPFLTPEQGKILTGQQGDSKLIEEFARGGAGIASVLAPTGTGGAAFGAGAIRGGAATAAIPETGGAEIAGGAITGALTEGILSNILGRKAKPKGQKFTASEKLKSKALKPGEGVPTGPRDIIREKELLKIADDIGLKGAPNQQRLQVAQRFDNLSDEIGQIVDVSDASVSFDDISNQITQKLSEEGDFFVPGEPTFDRILGRELKLLQKKAVKGQLNAKALVSFKRDLSGKLNNFFRKQSGDLSSAVTNVEGVRGDVWKVIDDVITTVEPGVKDLTRQQSQLHKLAPGLRKASQATVPIPLTGVKVSASPVQATQDLLGRILGKVPSAPTGQIPPQLGALGGILAPQIAGIDGEQPTGAPQPSVDATQDISQAFQPQDGENEQAIQLLKILDPESASLFEALSGKTPTSGAESALGVLEDLFTKVQAQGLTAKGPGILKRAAGAIKGSTASLTQSSPEAARFSSARTAFLSQISRGLGEKGTLTDKDIARVEKALPNFGDSPQVSAGKFEDVKSILREIAAE